jgi:hypothetical protein
LPDVAGLLPPASKVPLLPIFDPVAVLESVAESPVTAAPTVALVEDFRIVAPAMGPETAPETALAFVLDAVWGKVLASDAVAEDSSPLPAAASFAVAAEFAPSRLSVAADVASAGV